MQLALRASSCLGRVRRVLSALALAGISTAAALASTTINHQFTPATIDPGDVSVYRITIANSSTVALTAAAVTEILPAPVTIASPASITDTCGFTINSASPGSSTVFLTGGTIPAGTGTVDGTCFFQINVTSTTPGNHVANIPANTTPTATQSGYTAKENGVDVFNTTPANATLSVNTLSAPTGSKTFAPAAGIAGDPITLSLTLTNPNASASVPLTAFTDNLPAGMTVFAAPGAVTCTGVGASNGTTSGIVGSGSVTLTGGAIGRGGTCSFSVQVVVPSITGTSQAFTNTVPAGAIGNTRGLTSPAFSRNITVSTPINVTKSFNPVAIPGGQPSLVTITISNASTANALDITSFADNLTGTTLKMLTTASVPVAAPANPAVNCTGAGAVNGILTAPPDVIDQTLTLTGAKAGVSGACTITLYMTSNVDGAHVNTIPANAVGNPNGYASPGPITATLTSNAQLTVSKSATPTSVAPGQWTRFDVTINNFSGGTVNAVTFKDVLPAGGGGQMTLFDPGSGFVAFSAGCSNTANVFGTDAAGTSTGLPPTAADAGILWTGGSIVGGVGALPGVCVVSVNAKLPATATLGATFTNNVPIGTITGTGPGGGIGNVTAGSAGVLVVSSVALTKAFAPASIAQGGTSTVTLTLFNRTVSALTSLNLTDNFPAGLFLSSVPNPTNGCGGSLQAFPNDNKVILTNGNLAGRPATSIDSNCVITFRVTSSVLGNKVNTINPADITNAQTVTIPAAVSATLGVTTGLTGAKTFTPASVSSGGTSRVRITITNSSTGNFTNVSVDDNTFSAGLTVANPANAATSCAGPPTLIVNPGATRAQMLGATLNAGGSCDFVFDVVTSGAGPWSNTIPIGKITSAEGASNTANVTANLAAAAASLSINKSFNPVIVTGGVPSQLRIDVTNGGTAVTGLRFVDVFPPGIVIYSVPVAVTTCPGGTVTAAPGDNKVSIAGVSLAANATCTLTVNATSTKFLNLTNTIPAGAVVTNQGITNPTGTSATLSTLQGLGVLKAFSPAYVVAGQTSRLLMQLVSSFDPNAPTPLTLTGVTYTDNLPSAPAQLTIAPVPNPATTCAGTGPGGLAVVSAAPGATSVTVTQATIPPGTSCAIAVDVLAPATLGAYVNTIPANSVTTDQGVPNANAATATLNVVNQPTISKAFLNPNRNPGQATTLTVTINNGASIPITGVAVTDTLPSSLEIAAAPAAATTCTNGIASAPVAGSTLSVSGATIPAGGSCTFSAGVLGNVPGTYINNIPPGAIVDNEGLTNSGSAVAPLIINGQPTVAKAFNPVSIAVGATSTMTITLGNPNAAVITLSALLTDALPGNVVVAAVPNVVKTCPGVVNAAAGASTITYANGAQIPSGGCTISVNVTSAVAGSYTNTIAAGQLSTSTGVNQQPAVATLVVGGGLAPPTMSKGFSPGTILVNGTSALTISLGNPNVSALTLSSPFTDNLPANVVLAAFPNVRGTCNTGSVTATGGGSSIVFASGATIPAGGCTIIADVTSAVAGSYTNSLATTALVTDGGSPSLPSTAGLVVQAPTPPTVTKFFSPSTINPGATSTLTISIGNSNGSAALLTSPFTDNFPANVVAAVPPNPSTTCVGGAASAGAASVTLTGGGIQPGGCVVTVDVTSNVPGGPYQNQIPINALQTSVGNNGAVARANLLVNPFQPPSVAKTFVPTVIGAGGTSKLVISLSNGNASAATLTSDFVDTLPGPGLTIASPSNLLFGPGCTAASVVAVSGGTTVTYQSGGVLPGNGGCTIVVDVTSSTVTTYTNTVLANALKTSVGNNTVTATATLQVLALPTISKSFTPASIPLGASSSLTITLGNTNATALTLNVDFVDVLPANVVLGTPATLSGTCTAARVVAAAGGSTITYQSSATIAAGGCTITLPVTPTAAGSYNNVIPIGALSTTIGSNLASASAVLDVLSADLSVTKTDGVTTVVPGTATTYVVTVSNAGPNAVANAPFTDTLPPAILSASWTCVASPGSSCAAPSGSGSIASSVSLLAGGTATYTIVANVSPSAGSGSLSNTAVIATPPGTSDPNPGNNSATDTDTLTPQADLAVVKTGPPTVVPGQQATYTITATNAGPSQAVTVTLTDALPPSTTFVSLTPAAGWSCLTPAIGANGVVNCSLPTMAPAGPPAVFTLVVAIDPSLLAGAIVANTATITSSTLDPNTLDNSSTTTASSAPSADLSIVKTGPPTAVPGGPNLVFTTVVTNNGPSDAQAVTVSDPTPANTFFVSNSGACATPFPCSLGTLAAAATRTITSTYQVPPAYPAPAPIDNIATVSSPTPDPNPNNNSSTASVLVPTGVADVSVAKVVDNPAPTVGSNVTFTITASDLGPSDATGVEITDVLPAGLTFVSATPSQGSFVSGTGIWTVGTIPFGGSVMLQITATVTASGSIVNTATKTAGNETDPNPSNNSGSAVVNGPPAVADIQVQKTVDVPAPSVGANVNFTISVLNAGPSPATNVAVTDLLPAGLAFVSATPSVGTYVSATGVWTIGSLGVGAAASLTITANVTAAGTFTNVAQKTGETELDPNTGNDSASAVVVAGGGGGSIADLSIQKNDSPDPVHAGQPLTYTILVTNHGPSGASGVTVTDPLPPTVTFVSASASQGGCGGTSTVICTLGGLAAGNTATVTIVVTPSAASVPSISNTATVAAVETDPNPSDNTATAPTTVTPVADVAIGKTVSNPAPLVTQTFSFTVTATNLGPSTANAVQVTDVLPGNLTFVSATPSQGSYSSATGVWNVGTLTNGSSVTLVLTVIAATPGAFTNTATKTGETELDPNPSNDSASAGGGVGVVADLTIVKTHAPATFFRGSTGTFSLVVSNVGTGPTSGLVTVSDSLPAGFTPTAASGTGWACTVAAPTVTCTRSDALPVGSAYPAISVTVSVAQSAAASVSNTATVAGGGDLTPANDTSTDVVPVASSADLSIVKTGPPNAIPGNNVVFTLVVTNNGPSDAQAVVVSDPTPPNLGFVSNAGACATAFPCSIGTILAGASATVTATFSIPAGYTVPSPIVNSASVTSSTPDPTPSNNSSSASTGVSADLEVVKTAVPSTVFVGAPFTYQLVVTNHGPSSASGVTLVDVLPPQVTFQSATASQGTCSGTTTVTCALGTIANGGSVTVSIAVTQSAATAQSITNTASVTASEFDPNPTNNSSTVSATIGNPEIPTLTEWGMIAFAIALALAAIGALKRQI